MDITDGFEQRARDMRNKAKNAMNKDGDSNSNRQESVGNYSDETEHRED